MATSSAGWVVRYGRGLSAAASARTLLKRSGQLAERSRTAVRMVSVLRAVLRRRRRTSGAMGRGIVPGRE